MKKGIIIQGIVLFCICIFIGQYYMKPSDSTTPFETVVQDTTQNLDVSKYTLQDNRNIRRFLSVDPTSFKAICYYKNNDDMQASELVVVQFNSNDQAEEFKKSMKQRMDNQSNIYDSYLPKQANLVKKGIIYTQANYGIYVVNQKKDMVLSNFKESLKKGESK